jgi:hypothetical protein
MVGACDPLARTGRPKAVLELAGDERGSLCGGRGGRRRRSRWRCSRGSCWRARTAWTTSRVAARLGIVPATIGKWRRRFVNERLDGLLDEPRPGGPRSIGDEQIEPVIVARLERAPKDATHWSRPSVAADTGLSRSTLGQIWPEFRLKPHLVDTFKLSSDPLFIDKGPRRGRALPRPARARCTADTGRSTSASS